MELHRKYFLDGKKFIFVFVNSLRKQESGVKNLYTIMTNKYIDLLDFELWSFYLSLTTY